MRGEAGIDSAYRPAVTTTAPVLLSDEYETLDRVDRLDTGRESHSSAHVHVRERTLDELDDGLPLADPQLVSPTPDPGSVTPHWVIVERAPARAPADYLLALAGEFVTLALAGAAGAVLMFHQRVADILVHLR